LEFVIAFPLFMVFTLCLIQLAMLINARQCLQYAAYSAARAAIVQNERGTIDTSSGGDTHKAAGYVMAGTVTLSELGTSEYTIPGWGGMWRSKDASDRTTIEIGPLGANGDINTGDRWVDVAVRYEFPCWIPVAGRLFTDLRGNQSAIEAAGYTVGSDQYHSLNPPSVKTNSVVMREHCVMARPWDNPQSRYPDFHTTWGTQ
jgi:hypothetical protein